MINFRQTSLANDTQYVLDSALDNRDINAFDYAAVSLLGDQKIVDEIWETPSDHNGRSWRNGRAAICLRTDAYAHQLVAELPRYDQMAFVAFDLMSEPGRIFELAEFMADWNFTDSTVGGAKVPFFKKRLCDRNFEPNKGVRQRLYAHGAINRYVKIESTTDGFGHYRSLIAGIRKMAWPNNLSDGREVHAWMDAQQAAIAIRQRAAEERFIDANQIPLNDAPRELWAAIRAGKRIIKKKVRRRITKSAAIAASFFGAQAVSAFASGAPIEILGQTMVLEAQANGSIGKMGHSALNIKVKSTEGKRLAKVCLYFDQTPALDQLVALKLHMDAGEEKELLSTGNLYAITEDGANHPLVLSHKSFRAETSIIQGRRNPYDLEMEAKQRYFIATKHIYIESVERHSWGRDAKQLRALTQIAR